jgi:hypothetical protein
MHGLIALGIVIPLDHMACLTLLAIAVNTIPAIISNIKPYLCPQFTPAQFAVEGLFGVVVYFPEGFNQG